MTKSGAKPHPAARRTAKANAKPRRAFRTHSQFASSTFHGQIPQRQVINSTEESLHQSSSCHLFAKLTKVFLWSLSIIILVLITAALLAWSYASRASGLSPQDIINKHLTFKGPQKDKILNITTDGGVWVDAQGMLGVDTGDALAINTDPDDGFFEGIWKSIGRQGVRTSGSVSLNLTTISLRPNSIPTRLLWI
jgi:hypothetical protein